MAIGVATEIATANAAENQPTKLTTADLATTTKTQTSYRSVPGTTPRKAGEKEPQPAAPDSASGETDSNATNNIPD